MYPIEDPDQCGSTLNQNKVKEKYYILTNLAVEGKEAMLPPLPHFTIYKHLQKMNRQIKGLLILLFILLIVTGISRKFMYKTSLPSPAVIKNHPITLISKKMKQDTLTMVITRTFEVPLSQLWNAWSDTALIKQWWGPKGFTAPVADIDFHEEGVSLLCMRSPQGQEIYNTWTYQQIVPMERIAFIQHFTDKEGHPLDPDQIGLPPGIPKQVPHVITFKSLGKSKTELTITEYGYTASSVVALSEAGMQECLDKMEVALNATQHQ